jgi:two-component system response regulator VicR
MGNNKRILFVDDERDLIETVMFRLRRAGYDVFPVYDGAEALHRVADIKPDLILLDLMLPKVDGLKVCESLKKDLRYSAIPIIVFTARTQNDDVRKSKEMGADAYLAKPFEPRDLLSKINALLLQVP